VLALSSHGTYGALLTVSASSSRARRSSRKRTGVGMLVFTGLLVVWLRLRPAG